MKVYICMADYTVCEVFAAKSDAHVWLTQMCIADGWDPDEANGMDFEDLNDVCEDGCDYWVVEATVLGTYNPPEPKTFDLYIPEPVQDRTYQVRRL